jgi:hypothetical protein
MSVVEVRIYTIHEGRREEFVKLYDEVLLPAQHAFGLNVLGQFTSLDDEQTFVWLLPLRQPGGAATQDARIDVKRPRWRCPGPSG